jgi:hypothetical protein
MNEDALIKGSAFQGWGDEERALKRSVRKMDLFGFHSNANSPY